MHQRHGVVNQKWFVFVFLGKFDREICKDIGPVVVDIGRHFFPVANDRGVPIASRLGFLFVLMQSVMLLDACWKIMRVGPHAILIESGLDD